MTDDPKGARAGRGLIRLPQPTVRPEVEARRKVGADLLRPYRGRYVAQHDDGVLIDADNPDDVVHWLRDRGIEGAVVFRVPVDPTADVGLHGM
jgi:hypothetical protein